jgi:hypothetical protein
MAYTIRTLYKLKELDMDNNYSYEKKIYIKNKLWNPPPAPLLIEDKITEFEKEIKSKQATLHKKLRKRNLSNLTPLQANALRLLRQNSNFIIKPSDKNLGPAIMDTVSYIMMALKEHLLTPTYKQLTATEAQSKITAIKASLTSLISDNRALLSKAEWLYFQRSLQLNHRLPIFYGLPKVHKTPITLRPAVSSINSLLAVFSNWLDYKLKELLPLVKSFVKDTTTVIKEIKELNLPQEVLLFSADANSMCTNIETNLSITAIHDFLLHNSSHLPQDYPSNLILQILSIVMNNNIFSFTDTFWLQ